MLLTKKSYLQYKYWFTIHCLLFTKKTLKYLHTLCRIDLKIVKKNCFSYHNSVYSNHQGFCRQTVVCPSLSVDPEEKIVFTSINIMVKRTVRYQIKIKIDETVMTLKNSYTAMKLAPKAQWFPVFCFKGSGCRRLRIDIQYNLAG